ncbi:uncharacterized protein IUM83_19562 [Phytophthora cinnamomi]|uniref:uncharacterized protein n=1 Tax=Phytophthora cinnamomi TaxID=4785 RepID=UPI003559C067|nr:hypothetical protein IUM83_19562 [Phytophthora cinnamomi]
MTPLAARDEAFSGVSPRDISCNNDGDESSSGDDSSRTTLHAASLQTRRRLDDEFVGAVATVAESDVTPRFDERAMTLDEEMKEEVEVERESETDGNVKYSTLDSDGKNDEGTGWGDDALTEDGEPCVNLDEDGPAQPELRYDPAIMFDPELLIAAGGADQLAGGNVPKELLETITKRGRKPLIQQTPASTPSGAFFFFAQPTLWEDIATTSNGYFREKMEERIEGKCAKQEARKKKHPDFKPKTQDQISEELQKTEDITARDLCETNYLANNQMLLVHEC